jgi:hypothetical protein
MFFGLYVDVEVNPINTRSDTVTFVDTVGCSVVVSLNDTVRTNENFVIFYDISDKVVMEETFSARAKGPVKTLFISDERYFKSKNA